ncbi:MAG: threonine dehydratase [Gammaproteobacteria bacterium]
MSRLPLPSRDLAAEPLSAADFERAASVIYTAVSPTPQIAWPLLAERAGCEVWVKHENHLPTGAFKVRGGVWLMHRLAALPAPPAGVVAATRGNHGQSIAFAGRRAGLEVVIVVPHGNNPDKNRAMRAFGAELIETGEDFDAALAAAAAIAEERGLCSLPSFHAVLVQGVGTYAYELFRAAPPLDVVYAPIGLGSGLCGVLAARNALGLDTEVVGVVSDAADAYARSFEHGRVETTERADTLADGMAVRVPSAEALAFMQRGVSRVVRVSDDAVLGAMRAYLEDTHNLAEGAGAAPLAALLAERERYAGRRAAVVLSGGNVDRGVLMRALTMED